MAGIHGLQHVEGLARADLADDDTVRAHAQGVAHKVADGDGATAFEVGRTGFERDDVLLLQTKLGRILDGDDAFAFGDERRDDVECRRFTGARAARDEDVDARLMHARKKVAIFSSIVPKEIRLSTVSGVLENLRMVRHGPMSDSGGMMMLTREPSSRRASTSGEDSSTRRPSGVRMRSMMFMRCAVSWNFASVSSSLPMRSTKT